MAGMASGLGLIVPHKGLVPKVDPSAFIAANATLVGDVEIAANASIWFGCILRGDGSRGEFYSIAISNGHQQVDSGTASPWCSMTQSEADRQPVRVGAWAVGHAWAASPLLGQCFCGGAADVLQSFPGLYRPAQSRP